MNKYTEISLKMNSKPPVDKWTKGRVTQFTVVVD